jgi:hypothetical protein
MAVTCCIPGAAALMLRCTRQLQGRQARCVISCLSHTVARCMVVLLHLTFIGVVANQCPALLAHSQHDSVQTH